MTEQDLCGLIDDVRRGKLSRRSLSRTMNALGLTTTLTTAQMLTYSEAAVVVEQREACEIR